MELPSKPWLEAVDAQHPDTVTLVQSPLVLFGIAKTPPHVTRKQLLAAKQAGEDWRVATSGGTLTMLPLSLRK